MLILLASSVLSLMKTMSFARHKLPSKSFLYNIRDLRGICYTIEQTDCLLLLLPFTLNISIVTLFYSMCLLLKPIVLNLSWTLLLVPLPKLLNFIWLRLFKNICIISINDRIKYNVLTQKAIKLVNFLTSTLFFRSLHRSTRRVTFIDYSTFEFVSAYVTDSAVTILVIVVYRPGSVYLTYSLINSLTFFNVHQCTLRRW